MKTSTKTAKGLDAALKLLDLGFWPIAIYPPGVQLGEDRLSKGKEPIGKAWGLERWDQQRLRSAFEQYPSGGVGIAFGPKRAPGGGWLIDLEGDGPEAAASLATLMGGEIPVTPSWNSTRGGHTIFVANGELLLQLLAAAGATEGKREKVGVWKLPEIPDLEFRIGGFKSVDVVKQVQSVVPPTPGTDGEPRAWTSQPGRGVADLPSAAYAFLESLAERKAIVAEGNGNGHGNGKPSNGYAPRRNGTDVESRAIAYLATIEPAISGAKGHNKTFGAACRVGPGFDLAPDVALRLIRDHYNPRCEPPWSDAELRHKVDDAYREETRRGWLLNVPTRRKGSGGYPPSINGNGQHKPPDDRPEIQITTEWHIHVDEAIKALARDEDLYRRGDTLGTVVEEATPTAKLSSGVELRNAQGSTRFVALSDANVGCFLTRNATFYKWKRNNGEDIAVDCNPPDWLIRAISSRGYWPGIRTLLTVTSCPYVCPDGSIPAAGYDDATGTLYRPNVALLPLPVRPTQADAKQAAERLNHLVWQFPFATGFDWSVWLTSLLTAIQRPRIAGPVPGFVFNGNAAGIGKGLLIDAVGVLAWGHAIPTRTYPTDPIEAGKVKLSLALSAVSAVHFDNLAEGGFFGNSELDSALTSTQVGGRILGQSRESGAVPLRPCWFLSGNNISPAKDAYRRWLPCNLRTNLESPHERGDIVERDLLRSIHDHRAELLRDALVILKAHAIAGHPRGEWPPIGSFEEWDQVIRGAVWFATGNDCLHTQRQAAAESPERADKLALLEGWSQLPDGTDRGLTITDAMLAVEGDPRSFAMLQASFLRMSKDGKMPTAKQIGNRIRAMNGQNIGGQQFQRCGEKDHYAIWRVTKV
jgi:Bifunctional DNA primase/polymerase, N-terminal